MAHMRAEEKKVEMLATAYLAGEGKKPGEIAIELGISPVAVSRHLKQARKVYLREQVTFLRQNLNEEMMEMVRRRATRQKLEDQLNQLGQRHGSDRKLCLRVIPCGACENDRERMKKLGAAAALPVRQLLLRSKSCGLTWGGMLKNVVNGIRTLPFPSPWTTEAERIQCIPLSGEPLGRERASFSSSSLARDLGIIVNGDQYDAPSLAMVPAFIPDEFLQYERDGVWKLIELVKSYDEIFGRHRNGTAVPQGLKRPTPLALRLDMVLTSVGSHEKPLGFGRGVLFDKMNVTYDELKSLIVAEVGGVSIPRPNLSARKLAQFGKLQTSWTGLQLEHLRRCAARGASPFTGPPGVVVVSGGTGRAAAICELIKQGLINHLIIDDVLADELERASCTKR